MKKRTGYIAFFAVAAAFVAFAVLMERAPSPAPRVRIDVRESSGLGFVDYDQVKSYVEKNLARTAPDSVSGRLLPIERRLAADPYVERALVYRQPSGDIKVELWEEQPSFRILTDSGNYYVSRRDAVIPVKAGVGVDVPLVYGQADHASFPQVREMIRRLEEDKFFSRQAVGIEVSRRIKGGKPVYDYAVDTRAGGLRVVFGPAEELDVKFANFAVIYAYLYSAGRTDDYKVVNLEFGNYLICKKK